MNIVVNDLTLKAVKEALQVASSENLGVEFILSAIIYARNTRDPLSDILTNALKEWDLL